MQPKISIVTPTYNQAAYIGDTISSVLNQNYPNLEYIIIDGGSTDRTQDIIKPYEARLTYYESEKDNGIYDALNKGFNKSTGEIMGWINSDDIYFPKALYTASEIFSRFPQVNWIVGASSQMDESGRIIQSTPPRKWSKYNFYLHEYKWIQQESVFWRRSLWEKAGGFLDQSIQLAGDFELWLRFFRYEKLYSVNSPIGCFRFRLSQQKSLELIKNYHSEVEHLLNKEVISEADMKVLKKIQHYRNLNKIPILRRLFSTEKKHNAISAYAGEFTFNRKTQLFELYKNN